MNIDIERHQYQKLTSNVHALLSHEENIWPCAIIDISLNGCLLCFKNTWEQQNIEALYTLTMQLSVDKEIIMNLSMSHVIGNEVSFKCEHIDTDHSLHLQHFIGTDSVSRHLLARELAELTHTL